MPRFPKTDGWAGAKVSGRWNQQEPLKGRKLEPHIDVITLAVDNLERSLEFYRDGLGLGVCRDCRNEYAGDDGTPAGAAAMFKLQGELHLLLYPRTELAKDANIPLGPVQGGEFSIGHAVATRAQVEGVLARAQRAAAIVLTELYHAVAVPVGHLLRIFPRP